MLFSDIDENDDEYYFKFPRKYDEIKENYLVIDRAIDYDEIIKSDHDTLIFNKIEEIIDDINDLKFNNKKKVKVKTVECCEIIFKLKLLNFGCNLETIIIKPMKMKIFRKELKYLANKERYFYYPENSIKNLHFNVSIDIKKCMSKKGISNMNNKLKYFNSVNLFFNKMPYNLEFFSSKHINFRRENTKLKTLLLDGCIVNSINKNYRLTENIEKVSLIQCSLKISLNNLPKKIKELIIKTYYQNCWREKKIKKMEIKNIPNTLKVLNFVTFYIEESLNNLNNEITLIKNFGYYIPASLHRIYDKKKISEVMKIKKSKVINRLIV